MTPDEFINRMLVLYGAPETADTSIFFDEYRAVIGRTAPRVLAVAASIIRDEHEYKNWPVPAMVRKAIASAGLRVNGPPRSADFGRPQNPHANPDPESRKRVDDLVSTALQNMNEEGGGGKPKYPFEQVQRPGFEKAQAESPNRHLHLTERSRRMMGD